MSVAGGRGSTRGRQEGVLPLTLSRSQLRLPKRLLRSLRSSFSLSGLIPRRLDGLPPHTLLLARSVDPFLVGPKANRWRSCCPPSGYCPVQYECFPRRRYTGGSLLPARLLHGEGQTVQGLDGVGGKVGRQARPDSFRYQSQGLEPFWQLFFARER